MATSTVRVLRVDPKKALQHWAENVLEAEGLAEAKDRSGKPVTARRVEGGDYVLYWGWEREPAWRGDAQFVARMLTVAVLA